MKFVWIFLGLFCLAAIVSAAPKDETEVTDQEWENYKKEFKKNYPDKTEDTRHRSIYAETKRDVMEHNKNYYAGLVSYEQALNQYADLTGEEVGRLW